MKFIKKNLYTLIFMAFLVIMPVISLAQGGIDPPNTQGKLTNPLGKSGPTSLTEFIQKVLEKVLMVGFPVVALAIIYCGFLFVQARGNSEKLTKAKSALLYTLIGAAILLGSWAIAKLISETVIGLGS